MTPECVIDAELFKKYCLKECVTSCDDYTTCEGSSDKVLTCLINKEKNGMGTWITQENECIHKFLELTNKGKCKIYYNKVIMNEYAKLDLPEPFLSCFFAILSNDQHAIENELGGLNGDDLDLIKKSTVLKSKQNYLDIAASLSQSTIVSTKEDIESVYAHKNTSSLSLRIIGLNVCNMETKVRNG